MRIIAPAAVLASFLLATPAQAQLDIQQLLQGLTTGNQRQDEALRDAFERGYERGRQDEARLQRQRDLRDQRDDRALQRERDRFDPPRHSRDDRR